MTNEESVHLDGVTVIITEADPEYTGGTADDLVIFIDTDDLRDGRKIRVRINDALIFTGTPGIGTERVESDQYDGFYIVQDEN